MKKTKDGVQYRLIGASNHTNSDREKNDFYATDPIAMRLLLEQETFASKVWEPACGAGHLSEALVEAGYDVRSTDLVYRGYGEEESIDFLQYKGQAFDGDIITNPPYSEAVKFVTKALETITDGHKVAMFLKLLFLESSGRRLFFEKYPPKTVYVCSARVKCAKNGDFAKYGASAVAYAWYVWEKGYTGDTTVKWI